MRISLPQLIWYGNTTLEIDLPEEWQVEYLPMNGAEKPSMTVEQMATAINNPIGTDKIRDLAKGRKTAVIIFDDMTRPTRTYELAPIVIEELKAGGISEDDITFVCAPGTHGALTMNEFRKKLGPELVKKFRVFNHNIYENCVDIGTTSRGTKMMINREVAEADMRVAIGAVTAHPQVGFCGGGKIILPGIAHVDSISHYHLEVAPMAPETMGLGNFDHNILRTDIADAIELAGLEFMVNVIVNGRGATTDIYAGDFVQAHNEAVKLAKDHYATDPKPAGKDLVISNAFVKANEMTIAAGLGMTTLKNFSGTVVAIANSPEGQVVHYLLGRYGRNYGGRQYPITTVPDSINLIIQAPYRDKTFGDWYSNQEAVTWTESWDETLALLKKSFGPGTEVGVIPNATMQYYRRPATPEA